MGFLGKTFDETNVPEMTNNFEPIPEGWYNAVISSAEVKDTKSGTGKRLNICYDIIGPSHQGRKVFAGINIVNKNPEAEKIGEQQLHMVRLATGITKLTDSDQLIGCHCSIKVKVRPPQNGYDASNDVSGWKSIEGSKPPMPTQQGSVEKSSPAAKAGGPWAKH